MNWFNDLPFKYKISLPLVIMVVILLALAGVSINQSLALADSNKQLAQRLLPQIEILLNADRDLYQARLAFQHARNGLTTYEEAEQSFHSNAAHGDRKRHDCATVWPVVVCVVLACFPSKAFRHAGMFGHMLWCMLTEGHQYTYGESFSHYSAQVLGLSGGPFS